MAPAVVGLKRVDTDMVSNNISVLENDLCSAYKVPHSDIEYLSVLGSDKEVFPKFLKPKVLKHKEAAEDLNERLKFNEGLEKAKVEDASMIYNNFCTFNSKN